MDIGRAFEPCTNHYDNLWHALFEIIVDFATCFSESVNEIVVQTHVLSINPSQPSFRSLLHQCHQLPSLQYVVSSKLLEVSSRLGIKRGRPGLV